MSGNNLHQRFKDGFHVAELGFGTGLNLLSAWQLWIELGHTTPLKYTSFEAFPMALKDMSQALKNWPELTHLTNELIHQLENGWTIKTPTLDANIIVGDARKTLKTWDYYADAWFLASPQLKLIAAQNMILHSYPQIHQDKSPSSSSLS